MIIKIQQSNTVYRELLKAQKQRGYALLFAMIIVSIISLIVIGLSNTTYKQLILSSLATDSEMAYSQSDAGTECALHVDLVQNISTFVTPTTWTCGANVNNTFTIISTASGIQTKYSVFPQSPDITLPCFEFDITKFLLSGTTTIQSRGYNICDKTKQRTVEREILVNY